MFTGLSPSTHFDTSGVVLVIVFIVVSIAALGIYYTSTKAIKESIRAQEENIKSASRKVAHAISKGGVSEVKRRPSATPPPTPWLNRVMRFSHERRASKDDARPKDPNQVTLNDPMPSPVQVKSRSRSKYQSESRVEFRQARDARHKMRDDARREMRAEAIVAAALSPSPPSYRLPPSGDLVLNAQHEHRAASEPHVDSYVGLQVSSDGRKARKSARDWA